MPCDGNVMITKNEHGMPLPTLYTLHPTPYTQHPTPYTLHPALNTPTPHPTLYILHPAPCTLHPTPIWHTLIPNRQTLIHKP